MCCALLAVYMTGSWASASWDTAKWTAILKHKQIPNIVTCSPEKTDACAFTNHHWAHVHLHHFHLNPNYISSALQRSHCLVWIKPLLTLAQFCSNLAECNTLQHKTTVSKLCPLTQSIIAIKPWHIFKSITLSLCKLPYPAYLRPRADLISTQWGIFMTNSLL